MASRHKVKRKSGTEVVGKGLMRIDKSRTSPAMKAILLFIAIAMTISFVPAIASFFTSGNTQRTPVQYQADVDALESKLKTTPDDTVTLVNLGNTYFDWAYNVMQSGDTTGSVQYWDKAAGAYERAVSAGSSESGVRTDYAISLHYAGKTEQAVEQVEAVVADDATFAPAWFNMGEFKLALDDLAGAKEAYTTYLEVDATDRYGLSQQSLARLAEIGE